MQYLFYVGEISILRVDFKILRENDENRKLTQSFVPSYNPNSSACLDLKPK